MEYKSQTWDRSRNKCNFTVGRTRYTVVKIEANLTLLVWADGDWWIVRRLSGNDVIEFLETGKVTP